MVGMRRPYQGWMMWLSGSDGRGIYQGGMTGLIRGDERAYRGASLPQQVGRWFPLSREKRVSLLFSCKKKFSYFYLTTHARSLLQRSSIRFSKSLEYVYYSLLLLFTKKKRLIEPKNLNNGDFTWNRVLVAIVSQQAHFVVVVLKF